MSWLPMYNAWVVMVGIVSMFLWELEGVLVFVFIVLISLWFLAKESLYTLKHFITGFWIFILSEVVAFGTLFVLCLNSEEEFVVPLSHFNELPLLGCFLLTGSSITITTYHQEYGTAYCWLYLLATIILGSGFILLQLYEFYDSWCDITFCYYQGVCFATVGLHFMHVMGGLIAMTTMLCCGEKGVSRTNVDCVVWYWHFVDYVWLFVFLIIYIS
uniref:cytochrome c oxidase subunit III n=1 Tax=Artyfechinostomum malayanum TaxID=2750923 RepID=UPI002176D474|nr:cytochrome c oxidase subunit III [Artyfechinostomum malayanum]UUF68156.1 cytochrome c oxidase subunit III [Artyfechinostomum malayanum]